MFNQLLTQPLRITIPMMIHRQDRIVFELNTNARTSCHDDEKKCVRCECYLSAGCRHILLRFSQEICYLVTMNVQTRIARLNHLFFGEKTHRLSVTFELQSVNKLISQNSMGTEFDDHGMTFRSELHLPRLFDPLNIHGIRCYGSKSGHLLNRHTIP